MTAAVVGLARDQRPSRSQSAEELVGEAHRFADVFQINDAHLLFDRGDELLEPRFFDEGVSGENGVDLRGTTGAEDVGGSRAEIDHGRHASTGHQRQHRHRGAVRGRQHDADRAAFGRERHQLPAKDARRLQQPPVSELAAGRVLDRQPFAAVNFRRLDDRFDDGAVKVRRAEHQI